MVMGGEGKRREKSERKGDREGNKDMKRSEGKERIKGRGTSVSRQGETGTELTRQWRTEKQ